MREYESNSHRSRELATEQPEKKVEKVVSGTVKTRQNNSRKFADIFISEDAANVKSYIFMDVLVPAIKKAVSDIVTDGIDMILYGGSGGRNSGRRSESKVSYSRYYDDRRPRRRDDDDEYTARRRFDYEDLVYPNRREAETVIKNMLGLLDRYGVVSVADMYDLSGETAPYTSNRYGWTNLRNIEAVRVRDGYVLKLPKAMEID